MMWKRLGLLALIGGGALGVSACTDGYGYSGVSMGYGDGYYGGDPYYGGGYGAVGYGGLGSYYGWYGDYYYPGTGVYVYDRYRRPQRWSGDQQRYWQQRRYGWHDRDVRDNWRDFGRDVRNERRDYRGDIRDNRQAYQSGTITQDQFRQGRRDARQEFAATCARIIATCAVTIAPKAMPPHAPIAPSIRDPRAVAASVRAAMAVAIAGRGRNDLLPDAALAKAGALFG